MYDADADLSSNAAERLRPVATGSTHLRELLEEGARRTVEIVLHACPEEKGRGSGAATRNSKTGRVIGTATLRLPSAAVSRGKGGAKAPKSLGTPQSKPLTFEDVVAALARERAEEAQRRERQGLPPHNEDSDSGSHSMPNSYVAKRSEPREDATHENAELAEDEDWAVAEARRRALAVELRHSASELSAAAPANMRLAVQRRGRGLDASTGKPLRISVERKISPRESWDHEKDGRGRLSRPSIDSQTGRRRSVDQEAQVRQRVSRDAKLKEDWSVKMPKRLAAMQGVSPNSRKGTVCSPGSLVRLDPFAERDQFSERGTGNDVSTIGTERVTMRRSSFEARSSVEEGLRGGGGERRLSRASHESAASDSRRLSRTDAHEVALATAMFDSRRGSLPGVPLPQQAAIRRASVSGVPISAGLWGERPSVDSWQRPAWLKPRRASAPDASAAARAAALVETHHRRNGLA